MLKLLAWCLVFRWSTGTSSLLIFMLWTLQPYIIFCKPFLSPLRPPPALWLQALMLHGLVLHHFNASDHLKQREGGIVSSLGFQLLARVLEWKCQFPECWNINTLNVVVWVMAYHSWSHHGLRGRQDCSVDKAHAWKPDDLGLILSNYSRKESTVKKNNKPVLWSPHGDRHTHVHVHTYT